MSHTQQVHWVDHPPSCCFDLDYDLTESCMLQCFMVDLALRGSSRLLMNDLAQSCYSAI